MAADSGRDYIEELGAAVSSRWTLRDRVLSALPEVAAEALRLVPVPTGLNAVEILRGFACRAELPAQPAPSPFGQPPLLLHREPDFFIQALIWMDGTTAIHEHAFAGAFMVIEGMSLHVEQDFEQAAFVGDPRLAVGRLRSRPPEILRPFMARPIEPGGDFIHALFHLERPTVTIVVRNTTCGFARPQYSYRPPGLAWDGLWADKSWLARMQSIDALRRLDPCQAEMAAVEVVNTAPLWEAFSLTDHWACTHGWDEFAEGLVDLLCRRAPDLDRLLSATLDYDAGVQRILLRRGMLKEPHQRLLLALLANLPEPAAITQLLVELYPDRNAADLLLEWAAELSSPQLRGLSGLSISAERLSSLSTLSDGCEKQVLAEIRRAWGHPDETLSRLMA